MSNSKAVKLALVSGAGLFCGIVLSRYLLTRIGRSFTVSSLGFFFIVQCAAAVVTLALVIIHGLHLLKEPNEGHHKVSTYVLFLILIMMCSTMFHFSFFSIEWE